jgi:hypothetical protein
MSNIVVIASIFYTMVLLSRDVAFNLVGDSALAYKDASTLSFTEGARSITLSSLTGAVGDANGHKEALQEAGALDSGNQELGQLD